MSAALEKLRRESSVDRRARDDKCVCGDPVEVQLAVVIRERGAKPKTFTSRARRFCASCAVERMEKAVS